MLGFQAAGAAPLVHGHPIEHPETIATAIRIGNPASWYGATAAASESGGGIHAVTDEQILEAYRFLAATESVFCEPASAASVAGLLKVGVPEGSTVVRPHRPRPEGPRPGHRPDRGAVRGRRRLRRHQSGARAVTILDEVRAACAFVAERAELVRINESRIEPVARSVAALPAPAVEPMSIEFAVTFNAVNFGSGWHPHLAKLPGCSGNITLQRRLRDRFQADGTFTAEELARLTAEDCAELLGQELRPPVDELMALFARSLHDLGRFLLDRFEGSFDAFVAAAGGSAVRLVELLLEMPMYRDVASYRGTDVPFLKRAQLTASDVGSLDDLTGSRSSPTTSCPTCCGWTACSSSMTLWCTRSRPASCSTRAGRPRPRCGPRLCTPSSSWWTRWAAQLPHATSTADSGRGGRSRASKPSPARAPAACTTDRRC